MSVAREGWRAARAEPLRTAPRWTGTAHWVSGCAAATGCGAASARRRRQTLAAMAPPLALAHVKSCTARSRHRPFTERISPSTSGPASTRKSTMARSKSSSDRSVACASCAAQRGRRSSRYSVKISSRAARRENCHSKASPSLGSSARAARHAEPPNKSQSFVGDAHHQGMKPLGPMVPEVLDDLPQTGFRDHLRG